MAVVANVWATTKNQSNEVDNENTHNLHTKKHEKVNGRLMNSIKMWSLIEIILLIDDWSDKENQNSPIETPSQGHTRAHTQTQKTDTQERISGFYSFIASACKP